MYALPQIRVHGNDNAESYSVAAADARFRITEYRHAVPRYHALTGGEWLSGDQCPSPINAKAGEQEHRPKRPHRERQPRRSAVRPMTGTVGRSAPGRCGTYNNLREPKAGKSCKKRRDGSRTRPKKAVASRSMSKRQSGSPIASRGAAYKWMSNDGHHSPSLPYHSEIIPIKMEKHQL